LPAETPIFAGDGITLFTDEKNAADLAKMLTGNHTLEGYLEAHLSRLRPGDYFALLAYIEMNEAYKRTLQSIRHSVRDARHVATCLQFGPRFLHSTGQAYKGGPNTGVFLQITCDDALDLAVPDQKYTFGVVKTAQARGDFEVLLNRDRRALRAHLGADVAAHLGTLEAAFVSALQWWADKQRRAREFGARVDVVAQQGGTRGSFFCTTSGPRLTPRGRSGGVACERLLAVERSLYRHADRGRERIQHV